MTDISFFAQTSDAAQSVSNVSSVALFILLGVMAIIWLVFPILLLLRMSKIQESVDRLTQATVPLVSIAEKSRIHLQNLDPESKSI